MPWDDYHYHHHSHRHYYDRSHLAERFRRDNWHSHRPTRCIVNNGQLFLSDKSLKHSNTFIYNTPESEVYHYAPAIRQPYYSSYAYGVGDRYYLPYYYNDRIPWRHSSQRQIVW